MPPLRRSQTQTKGSAKKASSGSAGKVSSKSKNQGPLKNAPAKRKTEYESDFSDDGTESPEVLRQRLKSLEGEIEQLRSGSKSNKKPRIPGPTAYIPSSYEKEVMELAKTEVWRKTKFVSTDEERLQLAEYFITNMPEFQSLVVKDKEDMHHNIVAFDQIYGKSITKALNNKRTNVQGAMRKTYLKRAAKGKYMPTPQELLQVVIKRQGLSGWMTVPKLYALPQEPNPPEDGNTEDEEYQAEVQKFRKLLSEIEAKNREIAPKIAEAQANNAPIQRNRENLMWYWLELLPDVVGKHNWGYNIRKWNTLTEGRFPDNPDKKYITSSDEALCVTLYENCAQRFVYAAECQQKKIKEDRESERWQSKWSDIKAGQNNFGGFHPAGRARYAKLHRHIAKIKKKEETKAVEKEILKAIQYGEGSESEDEELEIPLEDGKQPPKIVSVAMLDSDDEGDAQEDGGDESELEEFEAVFQKPKKPKKKATPRGGN